MSISWRICAPVLPLYFAVGWAFGAVLVVVVASFCVVAVLMGVPDRVYRGKIERGTLPAPARRINRIIVTSAEARSCGDRSEGGRGPAVPWRSIAPPASEPA